MICANCGTENLATAKFCNECGSTLPSGCPNCGFVNAPTAKFCAECGTPQAAAAGTSAPAAAGRTSANGPARAAPTTPTETGAERRVVSVLFADLVGFTPYSEGRDSEEVRDTLSRYFEMAREVIERYGGTVEKFIGDAVMAVWGAPIAREDDAERAVRAALDLIDRIPSLAPGIQARAGVLTGEAAVTIGATNQGMVAGDLVNTAARLQSVAEPSTVLVGEATQRATSNAIVYEQVADKDLKGKQAPVQAWRAMRIVAQRGGVGRRDLLEGPFVGRDEDMRLLKDLFHATSRENRPRLVSVIGPGGIGKSRLAWEFLKYIDGLLEGVWWHDGRSPAYGDGITFWALGEMVRGRAGLVETDDEATTREKIAATVAEHVSNEADRPQIERALLVLLGFESGVDSQSLFAAWRTFFERLADTSPVVMVFEDLHFADQGLLDFIDHVLEWSRSSPITIVTLARPDLLDKRPNWGAGKRSFTSVYLEPLSDADMRTLLAGLVPGLPAKAVSAIVARADGIPLYAVETVRMLLAEGKVALVDGVYRPTGSLDDIAVPESLTALIAARLDSLDPKERALISDAAVLGQSFSREALAALSGTDGADLDDRLASLARRELLRQEVNPRSPELGQYVFVQALIREVAYNTLSKKDRKSRHLAAARFFESLGTEEVAGALAGQYLAAFRSAGEGAEADALKAQARLALRGAAERAAALGSHEQAIALIEQALEITPDAADRADLHERALKSAHETVVIEPIVRHAEALLAARRELGVREDIAGATAALLRVISNYVGDPKRAATMMRKAWEEFSDLEQTPAGVRLMMAMGGIEGTLDNPQAEYEWRERVIPVAERLDLIDELSGALSGKGGALLILGRPREGLVLLRGAHQMAIAHGLRARERFGRQSLMFWEQWNEPAAGVQLAKEGFEIARQSGSANYGFAMVGNGVVCALRVGEWDWALKVLEEWIPTETDVAQQFGELFGDRAILRSLRGDDPQTDLDRQRELFAGLTDPQYAGYDALFRAWTAFSAGRFAEANDHAVVAARAQAFFAPLSTPLAARAALWGGDTKGAKTEIERLGTSMMRGQALALDILTVRAGIAAVEGRAAEALGQYRDALRGYRALNLAWDESLASIDMVKFLGPAEAEVKAAADWARGTLSRLGAEPYLGRLDETLGSGAPREAKPAATAAAQEVPAPVS